MKLCVYICVVLLNHVLDKAVTEVVLTVLYCTQVEGTLI